VGLRLGAVTYALDDFVDALEHVGLGAVCAEHGVGAAGEQARPVGVGQDAAAEDEVDAQVAATPDEVVGVGGEFQECTDTPMRSASWAECMGLSPVTRVS